MSDLNTEGSPGMKSSLIDSFVAMLLHDSKWRVATGLIETKSARISEQ